MTTRADIVAEARTWVGTPFRHQGRHKGVGCDCVGLVIGVARALDLGDWHGVYGRRPNPEMMRAELVRYLDEVPISSADAGDILYLNFAHEPTHLAIVNGNGGIIHAYEPFHAVVEHIVDAKWRRRLVGAWQFRGLI